MPNFLAAAAEDSSSSRSRSRARARTEAGEHKSMWDRLSLQKIGSWLKREDETAVAPPLDNRVAAHSKQNEVKEKVNEKMTAEEHNKENGRPHSSGEHAERHGGSGGMLHRRSSRKVVPGLPRPLTFKRMNSEKRDRLLEVPVSPDQRRAASADRKGSVGMNRTLSPPPISFPSMSAPDVLSPHGSFPQKQPTPTIGGEPGSSIPAGSRQVDFGMDESTDSLSDACDPPPLSAAGDSYHERDSRRSSISVDDLQLQEELEAKWILNLSMHFRDLSDREKFFITYAEEPNKWRRVTVSCDYRQLEPDSLEHDLKTLHYQRDKSARIYEAIRDSLLDIQFYDTVTNLKLQTADGRLHVHVTEDVNEIIPYPSLNAVQHLECKRFREKSIDFDSHISGFVYKVSVNNRIYIKKEIPGPDAVEEFLYEINALCALRDSKSVIKFEGIIVDDKHELIKGLLISYADQGALVDLIYDCKLTPQLSWSRRERWARQIVQGLSEIHEAGFVQGDFTLSNIVIDHHDNAKIIDINRRGCPVGWEPPELARLIESGQRISIYIGVKSDLFQLGMVLWALAEQQDEPERQERPLSTNWSRGDAVPEYFRKMVRACLAESPKERPSAQNLLKSFPVDWNEQHHAAIEGPTQNASKHRSDQVYIDPHLAVDLDDISHHHTRRRSRSPSSFSNVNPPPSTDYLGSTSSYVFPHADVASSHRVRSPVAGGSGGQNRRSTYSPYPVGTRSVMSLDDSELELENELASLPASRETRWEQVYVDGDTKFVQRGGGVGADEVDIQDFAVQEPKEVCVSTASEKLENSFMGSKTSDEATPLSLSTVAELQPTMTPSSPQPYQQSPKASPSDLGYDLKVVGNRASFTERVHQLTTTSTSDPCAPTSPSRAIPTSPHRASQIPDPATLADLEQLALQSSVGSSFPPSRVGTGFEEVGPSRANTGFTLSDISRTSRMGTGFSEFSYRPPAHQDSGFDERRSFESERFVLGFDDDEGEIKEEDERIQGKMWGEKEIQASDTCLGEGVRGSELVIRSDTVIPLSSDAKPDHPRTTESRLSTDNGNDGSLEEKTSNTTIRPPSLVIPSFHHSVPKHMPADHTSPSTFPPPPSSTTSSPKSRVREKRYTASSVARETDTVSTTSLERNIDADFKRGGEKGAERDPPKIWEFQHGIPRMMDWDDADEARRRSEVKHSHSRSGSSERREQQRELETDGEKAKGTVGRREATYRLLQ